MNWKVVAGVVAIGALLSTFIGLAMYRPEPEHRWTPTGDPVTPLGGRMENGTDGNWMLKMTTGYSIPSQIVRIKIIDVRMGYDRMDSSLSMSNNFFCWNDNNQNGNLDVGDSITIFKYGTGLQSGFRVMLLHGTSTFSGPYVLP
jgi:hypothetical protein